MLKHAGTPAHRLPRLSGPSAARDARRQNHQRRLPQQPPLKPRTRLDLWPSRVESAGHECPQTKSAEPFVSESTTRAQSTRGSGRSRDRSTSRLSNGGGGIRSSAQRTRKDLVQRAKRAGLRTERSEGRPPPFGRRREDERGPTSGRAGWSRRAMSARRRSLRNRSCRSQRPGHKAPEGAAAAATAQHRDSQTVGEGFALPRSGRVKTSSSARSARDCGPSAARDAPRRLGGAGRTNAARPLVEPGEVLPATLKRWGRDSNPRDPDGSAGFQDRYIQPLCHPTS